MYFTERQLKILNFIRGFILEKGFSPTLEEIAEGFGISRVTAYEHIQALEKKGALHKSPNRARSIELADDPRNPAPTGRTLPVLGCIAAGAPIEAVEDKQELDLNTWLPNGDNYYILEVRGDSMVEEGIVSGDLVVVERRSTARNGEAVVALVNGRDVTLKRFYHEGNRVRLQPANRHMSPIYADDVQVQGVLVGLLRKYAS